MLGLIQRASSASVSVNNVTCGSIEQGVVLLLGIQREDNHGKADRLLQKVINYRIFPDFQGKMNLSLKDINGGLLVVSQFTLAADTRKGLRPSFTSAAPPEQAENLYNYFVAEAKKIHPIVECGIFSADMKVSLCNDGPVTFMLDA